jgi:hypothetical protein
LLINGDNGYFGTLPESTVALDAIAEYWQKLPLSDPQPKAFDRAFADPGNGVGSFQLKEKRPRLSASAVQGDRDHQGINQPVLDLAATARIFQG